MKLTTHVNELTLSNVGNTGEFRIRNSAKAFAILSSGLYSNKIRAIIRELSCNAVDSHVAAGKADVPFEVHLPNSLEPYFYVKDFGQGLDDKQVMNIYTTYFESTKTGSDEFIGALGLGSKSPFSYTENFTITAIKNGTRRVFTAFINAQGIPSVAEMEMSETTEDNGVEVKFSVNNSNDYRNFAHEAQQVFMWFKNRPNVIGNGNFKFIEPDYRTVNIVPGVSILKNSHESYAVMGNISYPLNKVPNPEQAFGPELTYILSGGLVIDFKIGELDIAASREELSYIKETIENIRKRLQRVADEIYNYVKQEAEKIENLWERAYFLMDLSNVRFMRTAILKYLKDTDFPLVSHNYGINLQNIIIPTKYLSEKYGITVKAYTSSGPKSRQQKIHTSRYGKEAHDLAKKFPATNIGAGAGNNYSVDVVLFSISQSTTIVLGDIKNSPNRRALYHFSRHSDFSGGTSYILTCDKPTVEEKQKAFDELLTLLHSPKKVCKASGMDKPVASPKEKKTFLDTVLVYEQSVRSRGTEWVWSKPSVLPDDDNQTYVYVLLKGWNYVDKNGRHIGRNLDYHIRLILNSGLPVPTIHAVRMSQHHSIKDSENWVYFDEYMAEQLNKIIKNHRDSLILASELDNIPAIVQNIIANHAHNLPVNSPFRKFSQLMRSKGMGNTGNIRLPHLKELCANFGINFDFREQIENFKKTTSDILSKYEILQYLNYNTPEKAIISYINAIDKQESTND